MNYSPRPPIFLFPFLSLLITIMPQTVVSTLFCAPAKGVSVFKSWKQVELKQKKLDQDGKGHLRKSPQFSPKACLHILIRDFRRKNWIMQCEFVFFSSESTLFWTTFCCIPLPWIPLKAFHIYTWFFFHPILLSKTDDIQWDFMESSFKRQLLSHAKTFKLNLDLDFNLAALKWIFIYSSSG